MWAAGFQLRGKVFVSSWPGVETWSWEEAGGEEKADRDGSAPTSQPVNLQTLSGSLSELELA